MFLNYLEEKNKKLFLEFCYHAAMSNNNFAEEQKKAIYDYCYEMNIPKELPSGDTNLDDIIKQLSSAKQQDKNIVIVELLGLIKSDGVFDDYEKDFMKKLCHNLSIEGDKIRTINHLLDIYTAVYKELCALTFDGENK